ncbi:hypothetical protein ExPUPEC79_00841 [Escherichia coli]|nr:hypothetical protein ExPUPEC79_00841 [Escherichia coli]
MRELGTNTVNNAFVDFVNAAPAAGHFGGKAHVAGFEDLHTFGSHFIRSPVQVVKPGFDQLAVHALALRVTGNDFRNPFARRLRNARVTFSHKDQYTFTVGKMGEVLGAIFSIIQTSNRRTIPFHHDFTQDVEAGFHLFQDIAVEEIVFRRKFEDFHCDFSDIAQCTFVADDDMTNVRASRATWHVFNACDGAICQHRFQTNDHILDCAVECGKLPDTAGRHQAAHLRQRL